MPARKIIVICPSAKPKEEEMKSHGLEDFEELKAEALAFLLAPDNGQFLLPHLATPSAIFACGDSRDLQPLQIVSSLSQKLALSVDTSFSSGDEQELALTAKMVEGSVVLISWHPARFYALACSILCECLPPSWWNPKRSRAWIFDRHEKTGVWFPVFPIRPVYA